jgi:integrase
VGSLGFEPRIANAPGWYPKPSFPVGDRDTHQTSRRRPPQTKDEGLIINTLLKATKEAKAQNTIHVLSQILPQLSRKTNLTEPEQVKAYIANATNEKTKQPLSNATKNKLCNAYEWFTKTNGIQYMKPYFKTAEGTPIIPTTENVTKVISASTRRYATIFTILTETGAEGEELHRTHRNKIDTEQGTITITGTKGHSSATYKLKQHTTEMLREYLAKNPQDYPFPKPKVMSEQWRTVRDRLANNLKQPELKNLRNYSGAKLYYSLPDPIAVMRHLRHKKLETTMHYIRGITINGEEEYLCKTATNVKEATDLIENGFQYVTEIDGYKLFKKRK